MGDVIFQASDLVNKRTELLAAARDGRARLRDKDGMSLVMLPESRLHALEVLAEWSTAHLRLGQLLARGERPSVGDLGVLAWLRAFDLEDLREFLDELHEALVASYADRDLAVLESCVDAWRITARQLEDPLRRSVLMGSTEAVDLVDAPRPDED